MPGAFRCKMEFCIAGTGTNLDSATKDIELELLVASGARLEFWLKTSATCG